MAEACRYVLELVVPDDEPVDVKIQKLASGLRDARTELTKVQFDLNLKISELQLKAHPSTPLEVIDQRETTVKDVVAVVNNVITECTVLFEQALEVVTNL